MNFDFTHRVLTDDTEYYTWDRITQTVGVDPERSVVIVMDPWNQNSNLVPRIPALNSYLEARRTEGFTICFSPFGAEEAYRVHPCRIRAREAYQAVKDTYAFPKRQNLKNVERPTDISGSNGRLDEKVRNFLGREFVSGGTSGSFLIHPGLTIDSDKDIIAFDINEVIGFFANQTKTIDWIFFCGQHLQWCILNRKIGIEEWKRRGITNLAVNGNVVAAVNNPRSPPYLTMEEMIELYLKYIESFWGYSVA